MIQSGRHKIETEEQFAKSLQYCQSLKLDGLVVIGGDDSNTNACLLAEYFLKNNCQTCVIGCPKTIDGDLKNEFVEVSFGFDTACKTYSELIGNIMLDTVSSKKYYHFIRLMGRSASHIALECALLTKPNWAFIGEEVKATKQTLHSIVTELTDLIVQRSAQGKNYGVILVPEGLIEFIDEVSKLISEINSILAKQVQQLTVDEIYIYVKEKLSAQNAQLLDFLPRSISNQLLLDRDPHGNVQVAKIETEKLLVSMVETEIQRRREAGQYNGPNFHTICHYYGYEGRCAFPTNFDCDYCYSLGVNAALLIEGKQTGMMSCLRELHKKPIEWKAGGYPLVTMMDVETRKGKQVPVITKALVELQGPLFQLYQRNRKQWAIDDFYQSPGPIQFYFDLPSPYLIKAPTEEQLGLKVNDVDYSNGVPYESIYAKNMSSLALKRADKTVLPPQLKHNLGHHIIETSNYSNQLMKTLNDHFPELLSVSKNAIQFINHNSPYAIRHEERKGLKLGVTLNGRQSPGGNVIIQGLLEFATQTQSKLYGFIGGTKGLFKNKYIEITKDNSHYYVNQGGYHLLGRTADKMRSPEELVAIKTTCQTLDLDGLIVVGASHTLTDCLIVANYLLRENIKTRVTAIPCTVDNNISHQMLEGIVGFDTASKTYSQLIGNIMIDAASAVKYWYFIRLMGRDPSHLVLECALQTHPNLTIISEDIAQRGLTLQELVNEIADVIVLRSNKGKEFGTVLVPEGLLAHIGQFKQLINELNKLFEQYEKNKIEQLITDIAKHLTPWSAALFESLPDFTRQQLVLERDVHGGVQLSMLETERLLAHLVEIELQNRKQAKKYKGTFAPICHFFGYQGRCAFPSIFDCHLAAAYGYLAGLIVLKGFTGYCVSARGITGNYDRWHFAAIPILNMCILKMKSAYGENEPVVPSYEVDTRKAPFQKFQQLSPEWWLTDHYENPGPVQFFGPKCEKSNITTELTFKNYVDQVEKIESLANDITELCRYETRDELLEVSIDQLKTLLKTIKILQ